MNDVALLHAILDPLFQLAGLVAVGLAPVFANYLIQVLHARFKLDLTAAQVKTIHDAADTAAGVLVAQMARGEVSLEHLHIDSPAVLAVAQIARNAVPDAADKMGVTIPDLAHIIVGRVGQAIAQDPTTTTVAPAKPAPAVVAAPAAAQ
jgi:hypothetical protein